MIEKIKELTKDTAIYGISTIIGRFLGFFLVPFYTNVINTGDFGIYSNIFAYIAILNIIYIYGMDAAFMKYTSIAALERKKDTFSTPYIFVTITTLILSFILFILKSSFLSLIEIPPQYEKIFYYVVLIIFFDTLTLIPFANLRLQRKAKKFTAIKFLNIVINITLNFVLILQYKLGIEAIFIANLIASIFSFVAVMPDILRLLVLRIDKEALRRMLKFGLPYLPASLSAMIVQVIDRPIVLALTNADTLGIYQANYKLGVFMMLFVVMFQYAWQPFFLNNAKEENAKQIFSKILTLFLLASSIIWVILTLFVDDIARFQFLPGKSIIGQQYLSGLVIVPIILLGYLFNGLYVNFMAGLYIEEKTKYFPYITGTGAIINIVVNILLIPVLGIIGAALATLASYVVMAAGLFFFSQKYYKIKYEYEKVFKILAVIIITCVLYYYLYYQTGLNLIYKLILLFGFVGSLFVLKVVEKNEIVRLVKMLLRVK